MTLSDAIKRIFDLEVEMRYTAVQQMNNHTLVYAEGAARCNNTYQETEYNAEALRLARQVLEGVQANVDES